MRERLRLEVGDEEEAKERERGEGGEQKGACASMDDIMVELVATVLCEVDATTLPGCEFVCRWWREVLCSHHSALALWCLVVVAQAKGQ